MTKFLAAAALATVIAAPAYAQTAVQTPRSQFYEQNSSRGPQRSVNPGFNVYENGRYVGSDPDPNVRLQLRRDYDVNDN